MSAATASPTEPSRSRRARTRRSIENVRRGTDPVPAELTVTKICPDRRQAASTHHRRADAARMVATADRWPSPGSTTSASRRNRHQPRRPRTRGRACAPDGTATLTGQQQPAWITNVRTAAGPGAARGTGTVEIEKQCNPPAPRASSSCGRWAHFPLGAARAQGLVIGVGDHRVGRWQSRVTSRFRRQSAAIARRTVPSP
jgi:hypothetical protein